MKASLQDLIASGRPIIADGAMGTNLIDLGLEMGKPTSLWNVERPEVVRKVHREFIEAGARIILSNSFSCNRLGLARYDMAQRAAELTQAAVQNARAEADAAAKPVVVGGSIGPTGELFEPYGTLTFDHASSAFEELARALAAGGADVFWIETMSDLEEVRAAYESCRRADPDLPVVTTMSFDTGGRTMMGVTPEQALESLKGFGPLAIGANCGSGLDEVKTVIEKMHAADPEVVLVAKANAGRPRLEGDVEVYDAGPEDMADYARAVYERGAWIVGGCCGSKPDHIRAMARALSAA